MGASRLDKGAASEKSLTAALISDPCSIQGFYNLLLQCKVGIAKVGPQAGLPPTLLSSSYFKKSVEEELKVRLQFAVAKCLAQSFNLPKLVELF